jgi:hypothetical protein
MPSGRVDRDQYLDNSSGRPAMTRSARRTGRRHCQASQKLIRRIRTRVVKTSQGIMTTSTLILRTAGMSLSTFGSRSKNRCRFRKIYAPPNKLTMKKNVAAIRKAGRTEGLISANMIFSIVLGPLFSQASKAEHFTKFRFVKRVLKQRSRTHCRLSW